MSLFDFEMPHEERPADAARPLAERMRPERLEDFAGQEHLLGPGKPLRVQIESDRLTSLILWGPPGTGKTTLAFLIARITRCASGSNDAAASSSRAVTAQSCRRPSSPWISRTCPSLFSSAGP